MSINIKIAKAYIILITASFLGHILSMSKEILVANYFGISIKMDAFYTAITIPNLITGTFVGAFGLVFLPILVQYKTVNTEEANRIASIAINWIFISMLFVSIILFIFSKQIIFYFFGGLSSETAMMAIKLLRIMSFTIILTGLIGIMTWILNAYEHFSAPSFSQMFITISIIAFILFFVKRMGIYVFAWGTLAGLIIQFVFLLPFTKKEGYTHYFDFNLNHPALKKTINLSLIFILLGIIAGIIPVVNRMMASWWLPAGSIAAMGYAEKLVQVPLIVFSGSIATAIYPFFARQLAENKIEEMKDTLATSIKMTGFVFIPLAVTMIILSKPTIQLLFQRGAFDEQATNLTSVIFICYSFQLFSNYAMVIMSRLLFAFQDMKKIFIINLISVGLTVIFNFIFIKPMKMQAEGIALSSSVACLIVTILYFLFLKKRIKNLHGISIIKSLFKTTVLAAISGIFIFFTHQFLNKFISDQSIAGKIFILAGSASSGIIVFTVMTSIFKIEEAGKIYILIKNKVKNTLKFGIIKKYDYN